MEIIPSMNITKKTLSGEDFDINFDIIYLNQAIVSLWRMRVFEDIISLSRMVSVIVKTKSILYSSLLP